MTKTDKYRLVNYFDTYYIEGEGWEVNNLCYEDVLIELESRSDNEIIVKLIKAGFLLPTVKPEQFDIWNDYEMIEISIKDSGEPICRLELIR